MGRGWGLGLSKASIKLTGAAGNFTVKEKRMIFMRFFESIYRC